MASAQPRSIPSATEFIRTVPASFFLRWPHAARGGVCTIAGTADKTVNGNERSDGTAVAGDRGRRSRAHLYAPAFLSASSGQEEDGQNDCPNDAPAKPSNIWVSRLQFEDFLVDHHEYDFRLSLAPVPKRFMPIQLDPDQGETFSSL
jgi:hypothetical protein